MREPRKSINASKHINLSLNNNTPPNENQEDKNKTLESKTLDVRHIFVHDDRLTLRINSKLKEAFLRHCKAKGVSVCHILEGLIYGYLSGFYEKIDTDVKSPTINLTLVRDVKRVRRYAVEEEEEPKDVCFYCLPRRVRAVGLFRYVKTGEVFALCQSHAKELVGSGLWTCV